MQLIPCPDPIEEDRGRMPFSLTPKVYGQFLCKLFDLWYDDWEKENYHSIPDYKKVERTNSYAPLFC